MSLCKTGCGNEASETAGGYLCELCNAAWGKSAERKRSAAICSEEWHDTNRYNRVCTCLMDFCTRIRAERQNGGQNEEAA